jgi:hypothetical protein
MSSEDKEIDPSEFVQRIRRLGDQRDQEDAERVKKLEEELIQGRSERLARRAGGCFCAELEMVTADVSVNRTSALHLPRQTLHTAIATLPGRHPSNGTGKGRQHAHADHEPSIARHGPPRLAAAPPELPRAIDFRRNGAQETCYQRGGIGAIGHAVVEAETAVGQHAAAALSGITIPRKSVCYQHARTLLARAEPLEKLHRSIVRRQRPDLLPPDTRRRQGISGIQEEPGRHRVGGSFSIRQKTASGHVTRVDGRAGD